MLYIKYINMYMHIYFFLGFLSGFDWNLLKDVTLGLYITLFIRYSFADIVLSDTSAYIWSGIN